MGDHNLRRIWDVRTKDGILIQFKSWKSANSADNARLAKQLAEDYRAVDGHEKNIRWIFEKRGDIQRPDDIIPRMEIALDGYVNPDTGTLTPEGERFFGSVRELSEFQHTLTEVVAVIAVPQP